MELNKLFEPIKIGALDLKNKIVMSPMGTNYVIHGDVNQRLLNFYEARAKGGVGLIGVTVMPNRLNNTPPAPAIWDDRFIPGLAQLAQVCHKYDVKVFAQLLVTYSWAFPGRPVELVSPSGHTVTGRVDPPFGLGGPPRGSSTMRRSLEEFEIVEIIEALGDASRRVREAGLDGIQYIAAAGYLVSQFISPLTNKRTDSYGGNLENRMRFLVESIENSKAKAGKDWTYLVRLSGQWTGNAISVEDLKDIATMLEKAGVHAIDILPGWHEDPIPMVAPAVAQGQWGDIANEVKRAVRIPIGAGSQIQDPAVAERILEEEKADYIYMCRALIADPDLPNKAKAGQLDDICPCITCSRCLEAVSFGRSVYCAVNPRAGKEGDYTIEPIEKAKKVYIVGGGPGGMEAAIVAAKRGHEVTIFERAEQLGGQLNLAAVPPHKGRIAQFEEYLAGQVKKMNVKVELQKEFTAELAEEGKPDLVIVAIGALAIVPDIPGVKKKHVITALDAIGESKETGKKVVIVGGGTVGCETAELLAKKGSDVTILEMLGHLAMDESTTSRWHLLSRLREAGVRAETDVKVVRITDGELKAVRDGKIESFEADKVVLATGMLADTGLTNILKGKGSKIYCVGDCLEPRQIMQAMDEGFLAGASA